MRLSLAGLWQVSPLTDLSIPQDDITFPNALSAVLPSHITETEVAQQEWHLMHDIEVDEAMLACPCVDLVLGGIDYYAEVRLNGVALLDCDGSEQVYRKDVAPLLQLGLNRFEILFLEEEDDLLLEDEDYRTNNVKVAPSDIRVGIWQEPYLQFIRNVKLEQVVTEQIWHHGGGCEFKVDLIYQTYKAGLVSASIKFNGMKFTLPIDVRAEHTGVIFQVEAPVIADINETDSSGFYALEVELDNQFESMSIALHPTSTTSSFLR